MIRFIKRPIEEMGFNFIEAQYIPEGKDEYYLRIPNPTKSYRALRTEEIEELELNNNIADNWDNVTVSEGFNPKQVKRVRFKGVVRIGKLENYYLEYHDLKVPVGIYDSTIVSCDLGDNVAINYVGYMAHYQIEDEAIIFNVRELITTAVAKFGNGIIKEGESNKWRVQLELGNENGGRSVLPFDGILASDIFLWSKFRDDKSLMDKFTEFTETKCDNKRGHYGKIGSQTIIKNTILVKDVNIGEAAYVNGANKLKNLTVNSSSQAPTQIGEGVELVNGIIGLGCRIFYGVKAVRFVMGQSSQLKYGARLINSYLGDNATISCCEVLNSLIYPFHEQHHNNSFLCAATLLGQTNLAAGATIGSNHNSRAADGEILAGRGFWPGLCVSLKHNSKFASFILIAKGDFPAELNIQLPFSLLSNNASKDCLEIMPAYWFMYNMYALARNSWKYSQRDKRTDKSILIEQDFLAPDTVNEIFVALRLIEEAVGKAYSKAKNTVIEDTISLGKKLLNEQNKEIDQLEILLENTENSKRKVVLSKVIKAYQMYKDMIVLYGIKNLNTFLRDSNKDVLKTISSEFGNSKREEFINIGGQLIKKTALEELKSKVKDNTILNWDDLHDNYIKVQESYSRDKLEHAIVSMLEVTELDLNSLDSTQLKDLLDIALATQKHIEKNTYESRAKDYVNSFRTMMYDNKEEMDEVIGKIEDNSFIHLIQEETKDFEVEIKKLYNYQN